MGQDRQDIFEALFHRFRAAGEINDQRAAACARDSPRKHTKGSMLQADCAHGLCNTWRLAVDDRFCRLRSDIARREAGSAGGDDQVEMLLIAPLDQCSLDLFPLIRYDRARADDSLAIA